MSEPADLAEAELVRRARAQDREAFCDLIRLHQAGLRGLCARMLASSGEADDIVQETFVRAWLNLDRFDPTRPFGPWLRTICRNLLANHVRDRRAERTRAQQIVDEQLLGQETLEVLLPEAEPGPLARLDLLRACCEGLPEPQRQLVRWRYEENLTVPQIGSQLGRSAASVAMALSRLRAALSRCVRQRLAAEAEAS